MTNPARLTAGDQGSIGGLRQSFPYFVPVRYLNAVATHRASPYSPAMLSAISPYMGNWILFSDFMDASLQMTDEANIEDIKQQPTEITEEVADSIPTMVTPATDTLSNEHENKEAGAIIVTETVAKESLLEDRVPIVVSNEADTDLNELADVAPSSVEGLPLNDLVEESNGIPEIEETTAAIENIEKSEVSEPASMENQTPLTTQVPVAEIAVNEQVQTTYQSASESEATPSSHVSEDAFVAENTQAAAIADVVEHEVEANNNSITEVAETDNTDNVIATISPDLEAQHNNFWSQSDEDTNHTEPEVQAPDWVEAPIPEQLPIKKTPAPEPSVQSQIPLEEFKPTQYTKQEKPLIYPIYTEDYFLQQGEKISPVLPEDIDSLKTTETAEEAAKSLMVMMSFTEWLLHFKSSTEKQKEETKDQRALKTMWQKEKLAAAIEEENEEIPENVFEMAVNSITKEDGLASESLADIYIKQGKLDKAIDMYRKLSLRNPQKNAYFARKIEEILKEKQL